MTGQEAIDYIDTYHWQKHAPGLDRIRALLHALGDPQRQLKFVHVAGTNGKGSTCAMIAAALQAAGYRVGLNTSPHLVQFHERIQINGEMISDAALAQVTEQVRPAAEAMPEHPTEFELITAIAMVYFQMRQCDIVVLEVGLGGELDASNVIDPPEVAVLTAMGRDHMALLGPTMRDVAQAKAGIIKSGGAVVSQGGCSEADMVFRQVCRERGVSLQEVAFSRISDDALSLSGGEFTCMPYGRIRISLVGAYQIKNALTAITALEQLRGKGWKISDEAVRQGLASVRWPGRFEVLGRSPVILLDGAHNAHGMAAAMQSLQALFPGRRSTMVLGILADKDVGEMLDLLVPMAQQVFVLRPDSPRALEAEELCRMLAEKGVCAQSCANAQEALLAAVRAAGKQGVVCALGSLYMAGDIKAAVAKMREKAV